MLGNRINMEYKIASLNAEFSDEILRIENESFSAPWTKDSIVSALENSYVQFYGIFDDSDSLIGFICASVIPPEAEILNIAVSASYRRLGVGSMLLSHMMTYLQNKDTDTVFLEVRESNTPARLLYTKEGFEVIGTRKKYYSNPTEDAILMQKNIV